MVFGWEGWRFVFLSVAAVSILIGALNYLQAQDPNYTPDGSAKLSGAAVLSLKEIWREMKVVMSVPTFLLIIMQVTSVSGSWLFCCQCAYDHAVVDVHTNMNNILLAEVSPINMVEPARACILLMAL